MVYGETMIDLDIVPDCYAEFLKNGDIDYDRFVEMAEEYCNTHKPRGLIRK